MKRQGRLQRQWVEKGTAQGQMMFWDATLDKWVHTEITELLWDDTNKWLQPSAIMVKDTSDNIIFYVDDDELYFTVTTAVPIAAGMPMGLLLSLTYAAP